MSNKFDKDGNFDVYNVSGTNDYYVVGIILSDTVEPEIIDSENRPVKYITIDMGDTETKTVVIYSYVKDFNNDSYLIIDGVKTMIAE